VARNNQRGKNNNNAEGHNQYSNSFMDSARDKPFTTAAAAAAAMGAGVFLWSNRNRITDQIGRLSDQITDWADDMRSKSGANSSPELETLGASNQSSTGQARGSKSRSSSSRSTGANGLGMSETGGGNASLGAQTGSTGIGAAS
jgi:hypothetical protein